MGNGLWMGFRDHYRDSCYRSCLFYDETKVKKECCIKERNGRELNSEIRERFYNKGCIGGANVNNAKEE